MKEIKTRCNGVNCILYNKCQHYANMEDPEKIEILARYEFDKGSCPSFKPIKNNEEEYYVGSHA